MNELHIQWTLFVAAVAMLFFVVLPLVRRTRLENSIRKLRHELEDGFDRVHEYPQGYSLLREFLLDIEKLTPRLSVIILSAYSRTRRRASQDWRDLCEEIEDLESGERELCVRILREAQRKVLIYLYVESWWLPITLLRRKRNLRYASVVLVGYIREERWLQQFGARGIGGKFFSNRRLR